MFLGARKKGVGVTVAEVILFWLAEAMSLQLVKRPKFMEPQVEPVSWVVA